MSITISRLRKVKFKNPDLSDFSMNKLTEKEEIALAKLIKEKILRKNRFTANVAIIR